MRKFFKRTHIRLKPEIAPGVCPHCEEMTSFVSIVNDNGTDCFLFVASYVYFSFATSTYESTAKIPQRENPNRNMPNE